VHPPLLLRELFSRPGQLRAGSEITPYLFPPPCQSECTCAPSGTSDSSAPPFHRYGVREIRPRATVDVVFFCSILKWTLLVQGRRPPSGTDLLVNTCGKAGKKSKTGGAMAAPALALTALGTVKGKKTKTKRGRRIYSFLNVPFAKPPIGERRFARPEPVERWKGILDCSRDVSVSCLQVTVISPESSFLIGNEDCLYLNVFTPKLPGAGRDPLLPVVIFLHGKKRVKHFTT